jgi:hypothetical protein
MARFHKAVDFYHQEMRPYLRNGPKKPFHVQATEIARLFAEYRYPPYQYVKSGLYLDSARGVDVIDYLPPRLIRKVQERLNPVDARFMADDKAVFRRIMLENRLPSVREILRTDAEGRAFDGADRLLEPGAALSLVRDHGKDVFIKPVHGTWGRAAGVSSQAAITPDTLAQPNILVQPLIVQHPVLNRLYPHSVNTVRIDTLLIGEGCLSSAAVLKLGVGGATVDNGSAGGLLIGVDLETGALDAAGRQRPHFEAGEHRVHPDTGAAFEGVILPFWGQVLEVVRRAAETMRPLSTLGWDVAITPEGVLLVEANTTWGVNSLQSGRRGMGNTPIGRLARREHGLRDRPRRAEKGTEAGASELGH